MKRILMFSAVVALTTTLAIPAFAHGHAEAGEATTLVIGWADEPAFAGFPNAVSVRVEHDGDPRAGAKLKVEVIFGGPGGTEKTDALSLDGDFGEPGTYHADLIPTSAGRYTFHITGTVAEDRIDVTMTSGEGTFDDVQEPTEQQFPEKIPGGVEQRDALENSQAAAVTAQAAAQGASDAASHARTLAIIGVVIGALGAILGLTSLTRRRPTV